MKTTIAILAFAVALTACSGQNNVENAEPVNISSLGKSEISEVRPADAMATYPKRGKSIERTFEHQPPMIPHKDYSITTKRNSCMNCHSPAKAERMKATAIDASHLKADSKLNNQYYNCTQCHAPQAENKTELVETTHTR